MNNETNVLRANIDKLDRENEHLRREVAKLEMDVRALTDLLMPFAEAAYGFSDPTVKLYYLESDGEYVELYRKGMWTLCTGDLIEAARTLGMKTSDSDKEAEMKGYEYIDYNWCPDCGLPLGVCTCCDCGCKWTESESG